MAVSSAIQSGQKLITTVFRPHHQLMLAHHAAGLREIGQWPNANFSFKLFFLFFTYHLGL